MDKIKELLSRITKLSEAELDELKRLILREFDKSEHDPDRVVTNEDMALLASAATAHRAEREHRTHEAGERHNAERTLHQFRANAANFIPADRRPRRPDSGMGSVTALTASGHEVFDHTGVAAQFIDAMRLHQGSSGADGEKTPVIRLKANRPDARTLRASQSPEAITASIGDAAEAHNYHAVQAITASGGLGAAEDTDYSLPGFESAERPVKSSLPTFTTDRGGVRFIRPPSLADVTGAVGIWTLANDIAAVNNPAVRKPHLRITPGAEILVNTQAITNIIEWGNLMARAYPEFVGRVADLALALHARVAEQQLLTQLGSLSTSVSGSSADASGLGAARVLLPLLDRAATGMRSRLRMRPDSALQLILPHWAKGILRSDLARQEPGDSTLGVTDAELAEYLSTRNLVPTWALEGEAGQNFNPQNPGAVNDWPTSIVSYLFPAGAIQHVDGGTLDLGIVRDSEMNSRNDFQIFSESFEGLIFRGGESLRISQAVTPSGVARASAA